MIFLGRIPVLLESCPVMSGGEGGGGAPIHPPAWSAPGFRSANIHLLLTNLRSRKNENEIFGVTLDLDKHPIQGE